MKRIRAVFFDLDDTLFPAEQTYRRGLAAAAKIFHERRGLSKRGFAKLYRRSRADVKKALGENPSARNRLLYFKRMVELHRGRSHPAFTLELMNAFDSCWGALKNLNEKKWLGALAARVTLGVITNQVGRMQIQKLNRLDPAGRLFKIVVTSEEMGAEKPSPRLFREACRRAGCLPREALMVGDSWEADVQGALRAGLNAAFFAPRERTRLLPSGVLRLGRLEDLNPYLKEHFSAC